MTEPIVRDGPAGESGVRALIAPESIGLVLAVLVIAVLASSGSLPGVSGPAPSAEPVPTASPSTAASAAGPAPTTRNALLAALGVNQRLAGHVEALDAAIESDDRSGATIATIVRTLNQDVAVGPRAAGPIADDPVTSALGADLRSFYADVARRGDETLGLSIQEGAAYRAAAMELLAILAALPELDDRIADALEGRATPPAPIPSGSAAASPSASPSSSPASTPSPSASASAGPSASSSVAPAGPDLIVNGSFDADLAGWSLRLEPGVVATASHDPAAGPDGSGAARLDIRVGSGARAGISFESSPFQLERGRRYRVTALLRSTEARDVRLRVATGDGRTSAARIFAVDATWSTVTFEITELATGSASVFALDVGRGEAPVWLDDVAVAAVD